MSSSPFKFDEKNPRLVLDRQRPGMVYTASALLFLGSVAWYNKRYFRIDQNAVNFLAFTVASVPASYAYSNFLLNDAETEAACINNDRELQK